MIGTVSKHVNDIVGQWSSKNYSNSDLNMWMKDSKNNVLSLLPDGCYGFNGYVDTLMKTTDFSPECVGLTV